jgi:hypothetical protein
MPRAAVSTVTAVEGSGTPDGFIARFTSSTTNDCWPDPVPEKLKVGSPSTHLCHKLVPPLTPKLPSPLISEKILDVVAEIEVVIEHRDISHGFLRGGPDDRYDTAGEFSRLFRFPAPRVSCLLSSGGISEPGAQPDRGQKIAAKQAQARAQRRCLPRNSCRCCR